MSDWQECLLGDIIELKRGYDLPKQDRVEGSYPIVSSSGVTGTHNEAKVKGPGVVTGRYGTLGEVFYITDDFWPLNTSLYVKDFKGNDPQFVSYFLRSLDLGRSNAAGAVPGVNRNHLHQLEVSAPLPPTQRRIASILSAYDDLIENNTRRIAILEEMARRLYEEWFVHFRFPGHEDATFIETEHGRAPEGWGQSVVAKAVKRHQTGKKYDQKTVAPTGSVPVLDQGKAGIIGYHDDEPGFIASSDNPVVVFANHTCYQRLISFPFSAIQNVIPFKSSDAYPRDIYWLHHATLGLVELNDYKGHWPQFAAKVINMPPVELTELFGSRVAPTHKMIRVLEKSNTNLRAQRDLLLPKLVSGEIDVSEAEEPLEDAVA